MKQHRSLAKWNHGWLFNVRNFDYWNVVEKPRFTEILYQWYKLDSTKPFKDRCSETLKAKVRGGESVSHTSWSGWMGYLRRGKLRGKWIWPEMFPVRRKLRDGNGSSPGYVDLDPLLNLQKTDFPFCIRQILIKRQISRWFHVYTMTHWESGTSRLQEPWRLQSEEFRELVYLLWTTDEVVPKGKTYP